MGPIWGTHVPGFQHTLSEHLVLVPVGVPSVNLGCEYTMNVSSCDMCLCGVLRSYPLILLLQVAKLCPNIFCVLDPWSKNSVFPSTVIYAFSQCHSQCLLLFCCHNVLVLGAVGAPFPPESSVLSCFPFMNKAPNSASAAEAETNFNNPHTTNMFPFNDTVCLGWNHHFSLGQRLKHVNPLEMT